MLEFKLYSKSGCHLCENLEQELLPFIEKYKFTVQRYYIDNEPALQELYGDRIPVLMLNDEILCHYFLDTDKVLIALTDHTAGNA